MVSTNLEKKNGNSGCAEPKLTSQVRKYVPAVDVIERPDELVVVADVAGATPEGINVQFVRGTLTLEASVRPRREENATYLLREYGVGCYQRAFEISELIDAEHIRASLKDGVLTITLPKAAEARPRKIEVKSA